MISLNIPGAIDNTESLSFFFVWVTIDKSMMRREVNRLSSDDLSPMCVCITFIFHWVITFLRIFLSFLFQWMKQSFILLKIGYSKVFPNLNFPKLENFEREIFLLEDIIIWSIEFVLQTYFNGCREFRNFRCVSDLNFAKK